MPPNVGGIPVIGGLLKFLKGPLPLVTEAYSTLGPVFTVNVLHMKITFLIGPEVTSHFYKVGSADNRQLLLFRQSLESTNCNHCFLPPMCCT